MSDLERSFTQKEKLFIIYVLAIQVYLYQKNIEV